ncbi:hypothetical protein LBMAG42_02590 [Deltaproteobacteria bacterium]|nr:hypothetical protein LBMAG42_02590 [Deltaproteobacteria bacterium]
MMLLCFNAAQALTLQATVERAASVSPDAIVAALDARRAGLDAAEAYASLGIKPKLVIARTYRGGATTASTSIGATVDASGWLSMPQRAAEATAARYAAEGTTLDAQYAAALLFISAIEAERALEAKTATEVAAEGTAAAVRVRVTAGLESELAGRSADAAVLVARAERLRGAAEVRITRVRLARALELEDLGELEVPAPLSLPSDAAASPWVDVASESVRAARWGHLVELAGWLPRAGIKGETPLAAGPWAITLSATWSFDGLAGPLFQERRSALATRIAETELEALKLDLAAELEVAVELARAAREVLAAHQARESLSEEALTIGRVRLGAGLASSLELLRLQDELASSRAARVAAELEEQAAILEARRVAGVRW